MTTYLFALWDGAGNVPPTISVIRALVARGHAVTLLADPSVQQDAVEAGAAFRPWIRAPHRRSAHPSERILDDRGLEGPAELAVMLERLVCGPAEGYAVDTAEAIGELAPDVVVVDEFLFGAAAAAEASGRPWAVLMPNIYVLPTPDRPPFGPGFAPAVSAADAERDRAVAALGASLWATGLPALNAARTAVGLPPLTDPLEQVARADAVVVLSSRAFDHPGAFPANVVHAGPRLDDPGWAGGEWSPPPGTDPLVLVSLSSSDQGQLDVLRRIVEAVASLPVRAVVTTGPCVDPGDVPAAPNVQVLAAVPHAAVLAVADAVVTHAGHGTLLKALARGLPVLCVPMGRDQDENAARVVAHGCGIRLARDAEPAALAAALRRLLAERTFAASAARLADAIALDLVRDRAADVLETLAARSASEHPVAAPG